MTDLYSDLLGYSGEVSLLLSKFSGLMVLGVKAMLKGLGFELILRRSCGITKILFFLFDYNDTISIQNSKISA